MARKQTNLVAVARQTKDTVMRRVTRRSRRIALGVAVSVAAVTAVLVVASSAAIAQGTSSRAAEPANVAANKRVVLAFLKDVLSEHHGDHAANYMTPDIQFHAGTVGTVTGRANVAGLLTAVVTAIPDLHPALQDIRGERNEVMVRLVVSGTQEGPLLGLAASGRPLKWDAIDLYRLKGGKIAEEWAAEDLTAILNDTGTYKAPWIP